MSSSYRTLLAQVVSSRRRQDFADLEQGRAPGNAEQARQATVVAGLRHTATLLDAGVTMDAEFRDRLRRRLTAVATVQGHAAGAPVGPPAPGPAVSRRVRPLMALAGLVAAAVTIGGVAVGASRSLPGEPLYALKRGSESLQAITSTGTVEQGKYHLHLAETRLEEVKALATGDHGTALAAVTPGHALAAGAGSGDLVSTLKEMDAETNAGRRLMIQAAVQSNDDAPVVALQQWSAQQSARLVDIIQDLPTQAKDRAQASLKLVGTVGSEAHDTIVTIACRGQCPPVSVPPGLALPTSPTPTSSAVARPTLAPTVAPPAPAPSAAQPASPNNEPPIVEPPIVELPPLQPVVPLPSPTPAPSPLPEPLPSATPTVDPTPTVLPTPEPTPTVDPTLPAPTTTPTPNQTLPATDSPSPTDGGTSPAAQASDPGLASPSP